MKTHLASALAVTLTLGLIACRDGSAPPTPPSGAPVVDPTSAPLAANGSPLKLVVAASTVCMVNDRYMGREQIAVPVGDKTYYGCCAGCKEKLEKSAAARTGTDPVTGKPIDKAIAVIARDDEDRVFYFESEATLALYRR